MKATKTKKIAASLAGFSMLVSTAAPAFAFGNPETTEETPDIVLMDTPDDPEGDAGENVDAPGEVIEPAESEDDANSPDDNLPVIDNEEAEPEAGNDTDDTDTSDDEPSTPAFKDTLAADVVNRAMAELGKPFQFGGSGPNAFDSSGLVSYCLTGQYGVRLGTAATFLSYPEPDDPKPGDICVGNGICGIYIGGNQMIIAPGAGQVVSRKPVSGMVFRRADWVTDTPAFKEVDCSIRFVDENDKEVAPALESTLEIAANEALIGPVEKLAQETSIPHYKIVRVAAADPEVVDGVHQFIAYCEPDGNGSGFGDGDDNNPNIPGDNQGKSIAVFCVDEDGNLLDERIVNDTALDDIETPVIAGWQFVDKYEKAGSHYNDFVPAGSASVGIRHWSAEYPDENQMFNPDKNESSDPSVPDFVDIPENGVAVSGSVQDAAISSDGDWIGKAIVINTKDGSFTTTVSGFITNKFGYSVTLGKSLSESIQADEAIISIEGVELAPSDPNFPEPEACLYFVYNRANDSSGDNEQPGTETPDVPETPDNPDNSDTPDTPVVPAPTEKEDDMNNSSDDEDESNGSDEQVTIEDDQIPEAGELVQTGDSTPFIPASVAALASLAALATAYISRKKND